MEAKEERAANGVDYDRAELPELLRIYYSRLFPYDKYHEWLEYGETQRERRNPFSPLSRR